MCLTSSLYKKYCLILFVNSESTKPVIKKFTPMGLDCELKERMFRIFCKVLFFRKDLLNLLSGVLIVLLMKNN